MLPHVERHELRRYLNISTTSNLSRQLQVGTVFPVLVGRSTCRAVFILCGCSGKNLWGGKNRLLG